MAKRKDKDVAVEKYRSRVVDFKPECPTADLIEHPENWRLHPEQQKRMLEGLLDKHGKIDAIIAYQSEKYGGLVIIDGHQRHEMDAVYPVLVIDVNDKEAAEILLTYNPIGALAETDKDTYRDLLVAVDAVNDETSRAIAMLAESVLGESILVSPEQEDATLKKVDVSNPPKMAWTVIGVPVVDYGNVNAILEQVRLFENVIVETSASDWMP